VSETFAVWWMEIARVMRHDDAVALLRRLHTTQNHFYAGGELDRATAAR
jgi:hypothetical protein